ncbi:MAG: signal recognition particle protein, partial [Acidobacteriota bacterium]
ELKEIRDTVHPDEVLFVADAMTGQDVVRSSQAFQEEIGLSGVVLTKMDGDARGGAALSIVSVTGIPIKFIGTGEGKDDLDVFSPERMAARILGMGDLQGFLEKVESTIGGEPARVSNPDFDLEQVRRQLRKLRKAGPIQRLIEMLPGVNFPGDVSGSNDQLRETLAILDSMTPGERNRPDIMNGDRRRRVARGSGTRVETVNRFLKQFAQIRKFMRRMPGGNMPGTWKKALKTSTR